MSAETVAACRAQAVSGLTGPCVEAGPPDEPGAAVAIAAGTVVREPASTSAAGRSAGDRFEPWREVPASPSTQEADHMSMDTSATPTAVHSSTRRQLNGGGWKSMGFTARSRTKRLHEGRLP